MPLFGNAAAWQRQDRLRADARLAIHRAEIAAAARGLPGATPDVLLWVMLEDEDSAPARMLAMAGIDVRGLRAALLSAVPVRPGAIDGRVPLDAAAREAVVLGLNEARRMRLAQAGAIHVILGIVEAGAGAGVRTLRRGGLDLGRLRALVAAAQEPEEQAGAPLFQAGFAQLLAAVGGERPCPQCAAPLHSSFGYCYRCGTRLDSAAE